MPDMLETEEDKTDGIVWQTTKPKLICRNYSTGNLQGEERQAVNETTSKSLSSLAGVPSNQLEQKPVPESFFKGLVEQYDSKKELDEMPDFVVHTPNYDMMTSAADDSLQVTWLGHASVLFQVDGMNILSDPVFGKFCGATQSRPFGQKRFRDCKTDVDNLPEIHAVVISHDHYDHLDYYTVKKLNKRFGDKLTWLVPLGTKKWMIDSGCSNVFELNWGDEHVLTTKSTEENGTSDNPGVKFVFAPAQHWCTRTLLDENTRLWGSWIIIGPKHRVYFAGDTGYCDIFKTIGNLYGPFDLAAIPIGAYRPRHVMINQHVDPEEAVKVHQDVKAKKSVAIHWGTFALAYENAREPPQLLRQCLEAANTLWVIQSLCPNIARSTGHDEFLKWVPVKNTVE
eukprot:gene2259-17867_t